MLNGSCYEYLLLVQKNPGFKARYSKNQDLKNAPYRKIMREVDSIGEFGLTFTKAVLAG